MNDAEIGERDAEVEPEVGDLGARVSLSPCLPFPVSPCLLLPASPCLRAAFSFPPPQPPARGR